MSPPETDTAPDQIAGAPHPREAQTLFGQTEAEGDFLDAWNAGRLHHGWLLAGPRGIGKATLAWRMARFLLATDTREAGAQASLDVAPDHPVARRILARSEPGLAHVSRSLNDKGALRSAIVVDDIRALHRFFSLSAADGGRRVVIVDAADEMNTAAANALLKMLEEPPARTTILLVAHQPSALLPTIRSRCRMLRLAPLAPADLEAALRQAGAELPDQPERLSALAAGSAGAALRLVNLGGLDLYGDLVAILDSLPRLDRPRLIALAESMARRGQEERLDLLLDLIDTLLARLARHGATGRPDPEGAPGEAPMLARLAPDPASARRWAALAATITERSRHGRAVNLDPAALVLDTVLRIEKTARR